ncbi:MAG: VIT1/CCC1 transporter family protein [Ktedonobacterales bacterium]
MIATAAPSSRTEAQKIRDALVASAGNIVFGMEDGTVSIFGLVFGVAASARGSRAVLLAGAIGAAAAAVSMMAGTYLDVSTANGRAKAEQEQMRLEIEQQTAHEAQNVDTRLNAAGFTDTERTAVLRALEAHPATWLQVASAVELQVGDGQGQSPLVQSLWMFVADVLAASIPVIPFAFLPLASARVDSVIVTLCLLVLLGIGRARVAQTKLLPTIVQTVGIATAAATAGFLVGKLVAG